jgi:type IV pilus assembly protein PilN
MRIDINLASRPYEDQRKFWLRWGVPMFLLGVITLVLLYSMVVGLIIARKDRVVMRDTEQRIAERDSERQQAEALLNLPQNRSTRDKSQYLNDLFERKSFSWTRVFEDLEKVMPPNLHVVSIRPEMNPDEGLQLTLVVAGESRDRAEELVRHMEESQHFSQTHIKEETAEQGHNNGDNVKFDIVAVYIPDVPASPAATTTTASTKSPGGAR